MMTLETDFTEKEAMCPCGCDFMIIKADFIRRLQSARIIAGIPFIIDSWCRCLKHNIVINGLSNSDHLYGEAVDIACTDASKRWLIVDALIKAGFTVIRVYEKHIHASTSKRHDGKLFSSGTY